MSKCVNMAIACGIALAGACAQAQQDGSPQRLEAGGAELAAAATPLQQDKDGGEARKMLTRIGDALAGGDTRWIGTQLNHKVFLTLFTGESGYYSAEQTTFILKNFLTAHTPTGFAFQNVNVGSESAFGVGTLSYTRRGQRGTAQVFVSLASTGDRWRITQVTVAQR